MHPPLDRPHPMCQNEINAFKQCHEENSKFKFWACNDVKLAMDRCLKNEKVTLLDQMNVDMDEKRQREEDAFQLAMGHNQSFEEFLKTDKVYLRELKKAKEEAK